MIQSLLARLGYQRINLAQERSVRASYDAEPSGFEVIGGTPSNDYAEEWRFPELVTTARKMMADPQVSKEIRAIRMPLQKAEWMFEPASDDAADVLVAEFCDAALLGKQTEHFGPEFWPATPWKQILGEILRFLEFGFSHFCITERQEGRFNLIADLRYLMPESIDPTGFLFEDDSQPDMMTAILRTYVDATGKQHTRERVEMDRIAWFVFDQEGGNILGRPLLRAMYKDWYYLDLYERLDMINAQKTKVGIPFFALPENVSPTDKSNAETFVKGMRGGNIERLSAVIPSGADFGWKEGGQSDKGFPASIEQKKKNISTAGLAQFMDAGQDSSTTRGTTGIKAAASSLMIGAVADSVIEQYMILARRLLLNNFPNLTRYPQLKVSEVDPLEKTRSIPEAMDAITKARNLRDIDLENEVRTRYGFMEADPDTVKALQQPDQPGQGDPNNPNAPKPKALPPGKDGGEDPSQPSDTQEPASSPATLAAEHDQPSHEAQLLARAKVNPDRIRAELEKYEDVYFSALRSVQGQMRDDVVRQIRNGQLEPTAPKDVKVNANLLAELKGRLKGAILGARDFGRDELLAELRRQVRGTRVVLGMADPDTRRAAVSFANQQADVVVNIDVKALVDRLQAQATEQYNQALLASESPSEAGAAVDAYFASISDQQLLEMSRGSTATAFNLGRHIATQEAKRDISPYAVRAEVLDDNTCEVCEAYIKRAAEGERFLINSASYFANMPPAGCEGRERCRGFYVVEALPAEVAA